VTTLATYTFPAGSSLGGVTVRGYATGRYVNNSGASLNPRMVCLGNVTSLINLFIPVNTNTRAYGWEMRTHFYFSDVTSQVGANPSLGCTASFDLSNPGTSGNRTGAYIAQSGFQVFAVPFANYVDLTQTVSLSIQFNSGGTDTIEVGCAYLEAL
jgi:hypothetical protein